MERNIRVVIIEDDDTIREGDRILIGEAEGCEVVMTYASFEDAIRTLRDDRPDVILLEGWCVGLRAEDVPPYAGPINALEAAEDPDGAWFAWSLEALQTDYAEVWNRMALLVSIEVAGLDTVIDSRLRQEEGLAAVTGRPGMDRAAVTRFVQHYERFTRALWAAMPVRADMLFRRDGAFGFAEVMK